MIESYSFGKIIIGGQTFTSDVIVAGQAVKSGWWREQGHLLQLKDLDQALSAKPEVLVVGTGWSGLMKVHEEVRQRAKKMGIQLVVQPTATAVDTYNSMAAHKKAVAALHLTC